MFHSKAILFFSLEIFQKFNIIFMPKSMTKT